eukprot:2183682-Prorocentrum_lima.AAC.1
MNPPSQPAARNCPLSTPWICRVEHAAPTAKQRTPRKHSPPRLAGKKKKARPRHRSVFAGNPPTI